MCSEILSLSHVVAYLEGDRRTEVLELLRRDALIRQELQRQAQVMLCRISDDLRGDLARQASAPTLDALAHARLDDDGCPLPSLSNGGSEQ
jgi:hypothetical protein